VIRLTRMQVQRLLGGTLGPASQAPDPVADFESGGGSRDEMVGRVCAAGVWLAIALVVLQSVVDTANEYLLTAPRDGLNPGREGNVFTWASVAGSYAAGLGAFLLAAFDARRRLAALAAGLILVYFSLDDLLTLHERVDEAIGGGSLHADVLLFAPLFVALLLTLARLRPLLDDRPRRILDAGALCLVLAVVFDEVVVEITLRLAERGVTWPHHIKGVFEEGLELAGMLLLATAFAGAAVASIERRAGPRAVDLAALVGVAVTVAVFAIQSAVDLVNSFLLPDPVAALDPGGERNVFDWLEDILALVSAAFFALVHGIAIVQRRLAYLALGVILCVLSADDLVEGFIGIAEGLPLYGPEWLERRAVLIFELPLQLALLALTLLLAAGWPRLARATARIGAALLALGIILDEGMLEVSDWLHTHWSAAATIKGTLEEGAEVAGAALLAGALASALIAHLSAPASGHPREEPPREDEGAAARSGELRTRPEGPTLRSARGEPHRDPANGFPTA
jgi:hypothetical protein